jgi:hypothetical protein
VTSARPAEASLLRPTLLGLLRLGWLHQMSPAAAEVPWYQKRLDLAFVGVRPEIGAVAVELKVDDWRGAIEQARLNRLLTCQSWVALWQATPPVVRWASTAGVGVLIITSRGVYPTQYPRAGTPISTALEGQIRSEGQRVRDLLSSLRHGA